jgi:hypothetical protein
MNGSRISALVAAALLVLGSRPTLAQSVEAAGALQQLRGELDALRADQLDRQRRIDDLQQRLESIEAGLGRGVPVDESIQAEIRGRGLTPPAEGAAGSIAETVAPAQVAPIAQPSQQAAPAGAAAPAVQVAADQPPPAADAAAGGTGDNVVREPARALSVEAVSEAETGFFGDAASMELGISYSHSDQARLNLSGFLALDSIFLGRISLDESSSDVVTIEGVGRLRLTPRIQVDVSVPWLWRVTTYMSGGAGSAATGLAEKTLRTNGIGDVSAGGSYRILTETMSQPDLVFNARVKAPTGRHPYGVELVEVEGSGGNLVVPQRLGTGSGNWGVSTGLSALKTIDPLVVFGNISYFFNLPQKYNDISDSIGAQPGQVDPGDSIQYGAGAAFAVNERSSLAFSFTQRFAWRTRVRTLTGNYQPIIGSDANVATINIGGTFAFSPTSSLIVNAGAGLTADSPDFSLSVRLPYSF